MRCNSEIQVDHTDEKKFHNNSAYRNELPHLAYADMNARFFRQMTRLSQSVLAT